MHSFREEYTSGRTPSPDAHNQMIIKTESADGRAIELEVPESTGTDSFFVLAVHKAGSVLFEAIVKDLCEAAERARFDLEPQLFKQGVPLGDCPLEAAVLLERPGLVFTGFRAPWLLANVRQYRRSKKLLIVRDPRDIAVSFYFSMARSHTVPKEGAARAGILKLREEAKSAAASEFVLAGHANPIFSNLTTFVNHRDRFPSFVTYKYEDVIFSKRPWTAAIAAELNIDVPEQILFEIADRHDVRPASEEPSRHIRQVTPGNYRKHLDPRAVAYIEKRCSEVFEAFGYEKSC